MAINVDGKKLLRTLWADDRLSQTQRAVCAMYIAHARPNGIAWPTRHTVAVCAGVSKSTVKRACKLLVSAGWLVPRNSPVTTRARAYRCVIPEYATNLEKTRWDSNPSHSSSGSKTSFNPPYLAALLSEFMPEFTARRACLEMDKYGPGAEKLFKTIQKSGPRWRAQWASIARTYLPESGGENNIDNLGGHNCDLPDLWGSQP